MRGNSILLTLSVILFTLSCRNEASDIKFAGWNSRHMSEVKKSLKKDSSIYSAAFKKLIIEAEKDLEKGPYSVTFKNQVPPGGTKHDYMSQGPYWWPDPDKPDGLPYIRRDGIINPESRLDHTQLGNLITSSCELSLAWYFTGEKKYAEKAAYLLRVWFIDEETKMNPNLEYGQAVPGINTGRGIGIIDVRGMYSLVDAISLLQTSEVLKPGEIALIKTWFSDFFKWLTTSSHGKDEDNTRNNHAVSYDVIVSSIAHFLGDDAFTIRKISEIPVRRINPMIMADGSQPEELIRTKAFGYSIANLRNFFDAGELGLKVNVNIFEYTDPQGGSIEDALKFLIQYIGKEKEWKWEQIADWRQTEDGLGLLLRRAARYFNNAEYKALWDQIFSERMKTDWSLLVVPGLY